MGDSEQSHEQSKDAANGQKTLVENAQVTADAVSAEMEDASQSSMPSDETLEPIVDLYGQPKYASSLFLLGVAAVVLAAALSWIGRDQIGEPALIAIIGALAGIGVFFLF